MKNQGRNDRSTGSVFTSLNAAVFASLLCLTLLIAVAGLVRAPAAQAAPFGLQSLRAGSASGSVDYIYTAGNVIYPQANVDAGTYYRFVVADSGGTVRNP
jgi:hypothetical protein